MGFTGRLLTKRLPTQRFVGRFSSTFPYAVSTYDDAFKDIMMDDKARNSFFSAAIGEPISSSAPLGLVTQNKVSYEQVSIDSVGDFLKKYKPFIEGYLGTKKNSSDGSSRTRKKDLNMHSFVDELATRFYNPLCQLFPSQDKKAILDFACQLTSGDMILVETQVRPQDYWDRRALAYAARRYSGQLLEGERWDRLKSVYSINILGGYEISPSAENRYTWQEQQKKVHGSDTVPSFIKRYELTNRYDPSQHIPHLQVIQLYPQLFDRKSSDTSFLKEKDNQVLVLKEWLEFFKDAHKRTEQQVEQQVTDEGVKMAYSILKKHEPTDLYKSWCDIYGKKYADQMIQETAAAEEKGLKEGLLKAARGLKKAGISDDVISQSTGLPLEEVAELKVDDT